MAYGQRPSKSADAARQVELARIASMSARDRVILALEFGERLRALGLAPPDGASH